MDLNSPRDAAGAGGGDAATPAVTDVTLAGVQERYPGWHCWDAGTRDGLLRARPTSAQAEPENVILADTPASLLAGIEAWQQAHPGGK